MKMHDPIPQFSHFVSSLAVLHPHLAFLHVFEPPPVEERLDNGDSAETLEESIDFIREIWAPHPLISTGGYTREDALEVAKSKGALVGFGRHFLSNVRPSQYSAAFLVGRFKPSILARPSVPPRTQHSSYAV